jgi:RNA polymerase sigma factor (sigma-70 family)
MSQRERAFVLANDGLPHAVVNAYLRKFPKYADLSDDLLQEARLAMVDAYRKYDAAKGKFGTYAWWWMLSRVRDYVRQTVNPLACERYLDRGDMAEYQVPATTPAYDCVDAARIAERVAGEMRAMSEVNGGQRTERDLEVFFELRFAREPDEYRRNGGLQDLGQRYGVSRQNVFQIMDRMQDFFEAAAADIRREAA